MRRNSVLTSRRFLLTVKNTQFDYEDLTAKKHKDKEYEDPTEFMLRKQMQINRMVSGQETKEREEEERRNRTDEGKLLALDKLQRADMTFTVSR